MTARKLMLFVLLGLAGCGQGEFDDLDKFVKDSESLPRTSIPPLPTIKPYEPFTYAAFSLPDPFKPREIEPVKGNKGGLQPDLDRRKEPLEAYPLEALRMVGTLQQEKDLMFALVKTPDNNLYRIKAGNYMGQNFGMVTKISESAVALTELIQDSAGDWSERESALQLQDEQEQRK
jgi:type IV pilus assembly protein PilP